MTITCQEILKNHKHLWQEATVHPFLDGCKQGTITPEQFNTWLVQDYQFVVEFTRMLARILSVAPNHHFDVLLGGLTALKDELNWFQVKAAERTLSLDVVKQRTCEEYSQFLESLARTPYAVQTTGLWAVELAYNQGWQLPGPMPEPYTEFADRWGNPGFTDYVKLLEHQADEMLSNASPEVQKEAEQTVITVAQFEKAFWQMAFNAT
ncbi:TenA family transcriptional regulator [Laspinema palackyanum]|uniref:TenA family transcriptional regulator n=1 Tax=Laspinema palackyanum TaxID=3231601 RepID=UPI00345DC8AB|nr:TenA family transcriptional regulator [Laspinema sp. D2c]